MAVIPPTVEPTTFTAGETVRWTRLYTEYPASAGTLAYRFVNASGAFTAVSTPDGDTFSNVITATASGSITAGTYSWQARYTETATGYETVLGTGTTAVYQEFGAAAFDNRTTAQTALDALEVVIVALASQVKMSSSIRDRSTSAKALSDALAERDKLKSEVRSERAAENIAKGLGNPSVIRARF